MRTITTTVYKFDELSEEVQQKVLKAHYDINVDHYNWWEFVYEDAKNIGLKITEFDIDRGSYCRGELLSMPRDVMKAILEEHGPDCETHKTAEKYLSCLNDLDLDSETYDYDFENIVAEFTYDLLEDYRIILQKTYEDLTSDEQIKETILTNEYEFTAEGKRI